MAVSINIKSDVRGVQLMLDRTVKKALPAAERAAVNALAFDVMRAERGATKSLFDNPRPFTQRAFLVEQAKPGSEPVATVYTRPEAERYLEPYEFGGDHVLPGKAALIPVDAQTDAYGQLPKGYMARIAQRQNVFVGTVRGVTGVWQRLNINAKGKSVAKRSAKTVGGLRLLVRFGNAVPVKKHLDFEARARSVVAANFMVRMRAALAKVIK
jgi:hypothetical protein